MARRADEPQPLPVIGPPSGHVFCVQRQHGLVWYAKYRTGTGRQVQKKLGPAWTRRGQPPAGYLNRAGAQRWLEATLQRIRARTLAPMAGTPARFETAAAEWLRFIEHDRCLKPTTVRGYRTLLETHLLPQFGGQLLTEISTEQIERWAHSLDRTVATRVKLVVCMSGIYHRARRVWGITYDPVDDVQRPQVKRSYDLLVYSPHEILALAGAAANRQDAAIFLTAAFTGLRMGELLALQWRDVDLDRRVLRVRGSWSGHEVTLPKSGKVRSVPIAPQVTRALTDLRPTARAGLVFPGRRGHLDRRSLRRRYRQAQQAAGLRDLRFHDLRHTFATTMVAHTSIVRVQEWMGHSDLHSTLRYLHYTPRHDDAELVARAFHTGN
jgi:integrase